MKKVIFTLFVLILVCQTSFAIDFYKGTYQQALSEGKAQNKPLFLYFTAKWCGPCNYMQQFIFPDIALSAYVKQNYVALKLDIDTEEGKLVYYKSHQPKAPTGVPAFIIMNGNEEILKKDVGGMKVDQLRDFLIKNEQQKVMYKALADSVAASQIKADHMKPTTMSKLFFNAGASKWKPGLKVGSLNFGYEVGLFYDCSFKFKGEGKRGFWDKSRYHFQPGISFSAHGGKENHHYLTLEFFNGHQIKGLRGIEITLSPYLAAELGKAFNADFNRLDYGFRTGIGKQYGMFQANLGYHLGLRDLSEAVNTSIFNKGFYFSIGMTIGK